MLQSKLHLMWILLILQQQQQQQQPQRVSSHQVKQSNQLLRRMRILNKIIPNSTTINPIIELHHRLLKLTTLSTTISPLIPLLQFQRNCFILQLINSKVSNSHSHSLSKDISCLRMVLSQAVTLNKCLLKVQVDITFATSHTIQLRFLQMVQMICPSHPSQGFKCNSSSQ